MGAAWPLLTVALLGRLAAAVDSHVFADDLEQCIRQTAKLAADEFRSWGDGCIPATTKVDVQAALLAQTITPFEQKYGYVAAVWCAFFSTDMGGETFDPNDPQPNNPEFDDVRSGSR